MTAYERRAISFRGVWREAGWRLKVYGIAYRRPAPAPELVEAARAVARRALPAAGAPNHGVGFVGVHHGRAASYVFVDWWANELELFHHLHRAPVEDPADLALVGPGGPSACVWDLRVVAFERQAWLEHVLANPAGPDLDGYLEARLEETS